MHRGTKHGTAPNNGASFGLREIDSSLSRCEPLAFYFRARWTTVALYGRGKIRILPNPAFERTAASALRLLAGALLATLVGRRSTRALDSLGGDFVHLRKL